MRLNNKVVLVTGGASGMGQAFVRRLDQEGAVVYFTDINEVAGKALESEINNDGGHVFFLPQDVSNESDWHMVLDTIRSHEKRLDVLINNAGMIIPGNIEECSLEQFQLHLDVNLKSAFLGCKLSLPLMQQHGGSIINMSSITAIVGEQDAIGYSASKAGVRFLSKSVALHCAEKGYAIRVNSLHPGYISTPLVTGVMSKLDADRQAAVHQRLMQELPVKRFADPDEVSGTVVFLSSDDSKYITGTEIIIDGGFSCH
ncbi:MULTISPECIES: SDR family oxidoreductase [Pseudomonas]|uniref:NAD(P)-dependent dehydrogenase, short-chain alcohol dehydrogenase family n=1 Tax=Pseudomonas segetis TaxID=298908 RepID=A0A239H882_9PSED|nr:MULTISPECIES: SDR family oxidoreductase [Pseudomonas]SNS76464.1 NAD(P)-dependent dehydrogenase, short-chain alcohol dehydrogenase family [Pseudomonas segetis]